MQFVVPKLFHVAGMVIDPEGLDNYLTWLGAKNWKTDTNDPASVNVEVGGRLCYRSFEIGLNANISRIREGNKLYLENIIKSGHGSVVEHTFDSYILSDVTRVLTHELVRHRVGIAVSQESLRFVRLTDLKARWPQVFELHPKTRLIRNAMKDFFEMAEDLQKKLALDLDLDNIKEFETKKTLTSALRRMAPIGLCTSIMVSSNIRNWRHIIEMRTSHGAEEEIREIFLQLFYDQNMRHPNLYQDATIENGTVKFKYSKI